MSETTLTPPGGVVGLAEMVAEAYAAHETHTVQAFALRLAETFLAMRPSTDHRGDQQVARGMEACARTTLRMAGLDAEQARTLPDGTGRFRMTSDETGFRTAPDDLGCSRTGAGGTAQDRTEAAR